MVDEVTPQMVIEVQRSIIRQSERCIRMGQRVGYNKRKLANAMKLIFVLEQVAKLPKPEPI